MIDTDHKSNRLKKIAEDHGWKASVVPSFDVFLETNNLEDIEYTFYALRDKESIKATWKGNRFQESTYNYGRYRVNPARSGSIIRLLKESPDPRKFHQSASGGPINYESATAVRNVPWENPQEVTAFNVLVGVIGKDITWVRKNGEVRTEPCPKESNLRKPYFRVKTTSTGKRVLEWSNTCGFQACYLDDIIDVT